MKHHLGTLSVLYYVYGALLILASFAVLTLLGLGLFLNSDWFAAHGDGDVPPFAGWFLQVLGLVLFVFIFAHGVLNIITGRNLGLHKGRTLSFVTAALNCLNIPFGVALGIYTFVTLNDAEVRAEYELAPR